MSAKSAREFFASDEWRKLRYLALKLHGAACQCCGATRQSGAILHVDHIKPRSKYPELELEVDNLQILCVDCNRGKGAWDETDWRGASAPGEQPADTLRAARRVVSDKEATRAKRLAGWRDRKAAIRRANGCMTRAEYEGNSLSRNKPWEAEGISRRTWYRRIASNAPSDAVCD